MPIGKRVNPQTGQEEEYDTLTGEVFDPKTKTWVAPQAAPKAPGVSDNERFGSYAAGYGTGGLSPGQKRGMASGMASGFPNPVAMGVGGVVGAEFPPEDPGLVAGQGLGETGAGAILDRRVPGAGYATRAAARGLGSLLGGITGSNGATDGMTQGGSAILTGLLGGIGIKKNQMPKSAFAAESLPERIQLMYQSKAFRTFLRGNPEVAGDLSQSFDQEIDKLFLPPVSETTIRTALYKINAALPMASGADPAAITRIKGASRSQNAEKVLRTAFGNSPSEAVTSAALIKDVLRNDPEAAQELMNAWFTRVVVGESLVPIVDGGLAGRGSKKVADTAARMTSLATDVTSESIPGGLVNFNASKGTPDFVLDGTKFHRRIQELGDNLDTIFWPGSKAALDDLSFVMKELDPANAEGFLNKVSKTGEGALKYNTNRAIFFGLQSAAGGGAGGLSLQSMLGAVAGTAAAWSGMTGLNTVGIMAMRNPAVVRSLRKGLESRNVSVVNTAWRALMAGEQNPDLYDSSVRPSSPPRP